VSGYQAPLADIDFVLEHIVDLSSISKLNGFSHADPETVSGVLAEAGGSSPRSSPPPTGSAIRSARNWWTARW
jgi:hypothetical protein